MMAIVTQVGTTSFGGLHYRYASFGTGLQTVSHFQDW